MNAQLAPQLQCTSHITSYRGRWLPAPSITGVSAHDVKWWPIHFVYIIHFWSKKALNGQNVVYFFTAKLFNHIKKCAACHT